MKKFVFRLESYLHLCEHREEVEQLRLHELLQERERIDQLLEELNQSLDHLTVDLRGQRQARAFEIGWYRQRMQYLELRIEDTELRRKEMERRIAAQMTRLTEARKKRRIVERLREHRLENFQLEFDRENQKTIDDQFIQRLHQRRTSG